MNTVIPFHKQTAMISKPLIDGNYKFTVAEFNIFFCALGQLAQSKAIELDTRITVTTEQYAELRGVSKQTAIEALEEAREGLWKKYVVLPDKETGKNMRVRILYKMEDKMDSSITFVFSPEFLEFICEMKRYITCELGVLGKFNSFYSYRLLFMVVERSSYSRNFEFRLTLEEFNKKFCLEGKYGNIAELKRRVILPAISEIEEYTGIELKLGFVKEGRKVIGLRFYGFNPASKLLKKEVVEN